MDITVNVFRPLAPTSCHFQIVLPSAMSPWPHRLFVLCLIWLHLKPTPSWDSHYCKSLELIVS